MIAEAGGRPTGSATPLAGSGRAGPWGLCLVAGVMLGGVGLRVVSHLMFLLMRPPVFRLASFEVWRGVRYRLGTVRGWEGQWP